MCRLSPYFTPSLPSRCSPSGSSPFTITDDQNTAPRCAECEGGAGLKTCTACKEVKYCSVGCQKRQNASDAPPTYMTSPCSNSHRVRRNVRSATCLFRLHIVTCQLFFPALGKLYAMGVVIPSENPVTASVRFAKQKSRQKVKS
jgi:hypothetical protein